MSPTFAELADGWQALGVRRGRGGGTVGVEAVAHGGEDKRLHCQPLGGGGAADLCP